MKRSDRLLVLLPLIQRLFGCFWQKNKAHQAYYPDE